MSKLIYIADDEKNIRQLIQTFLSKEGYQVEGFEDGESLPISGVFVAVGVAGSTDLAKKLGAATEGTRILVDEKMATNVPGLYAAGDCTGGMLQIAKAVYQGAQAGTSIVAEIRKKK